MVGTSNMNVVLAQGSAVREVQNIKKQSMEMNQQFAAQHTEEKKKTEKSQIDTFETRNKIEVRDDEEQQKKKRLAKRKAKKKEKEEGDPVPSEGKFLDITV